MYQSTHTGAQVDEAVDKALSADAVPIPGSTNLVESGGVASAVSTVGNAVSRRNLLDNWYFVGGGSQQGGGQFPINQRGQTVYSAGTYGIDRWVMYATSGNLQSDGLHFSANESITQTLESSLIDAINGKTVTMSVLTSDGLFAGSIVYDKTVAQYFYSQGGIALVKGVGGDGSNYAQVFTSSPTVVYAVKLELGDTQTLAHQESGVWVLNDIPNFAEELAKCQRYFLNIKSQSGTYYRFGIAATFSSTIAMGVIPLPVTMRTATPTITFRNIYLQTGNTTVTVSSISFSGIGTNSIYVDVGASGLTTGAVYLLKTDHATSGGSVVNDGYLTISCDL